VRKLALLPLLFLIFALAACGGGGSSSDGSSSSEGGSTEPNSGATDTETAESPQAAWGKEVAAVMSEFENSEAGTVIEQIHTSTDQQHLEPLYKAYWVNLRVLEKKLDATKTPAACKAVEKKMKAEIDTVAGAAKDLSDGRGLNPEQYAVKAFEQGLKIDKAGRALGALVAAPNC
jgi:hypothetical protein